jgi:hypothetical protein
MWQIHGAEECALTWGGLIDGYGNIILTRDVISVVTTNYEKSAKAIVIDGLKTNYEGLNFRRIVVNESY